MSEIIYCLRNYPLYRTGFMDAIGIAVVTVTIGMLVVCIVGGFTS